MADSIAFGGLAYRNRYPSNADNFTWTPLQDVGTVTLLLMPGGWDGTTWTDVSGHGHNVPIDSGAPGNVNGCPTFDGATTALRLTNVSLADSVSYPGAALSDPDNGSVVVVSKQTGPLPVDAGDYFNPATITGTGATPGLYQTDAGARCTGYDGMNYVDAFASGGVFPADAGHVQFGAWDNVGLYCATDALQLGSVHPYNSPEVRLSVGNIGADTWIGRSFSAIFTGTIYAVAVSNWTKWARKVGLIA